MENPTGAVVNRHVGPEKICPHYDVYRLTCDEYDQLRARSGGRCEICETTEGDTPRGRLVVEHYHWRGLWFVRGLVCDRCNRVMACHDRAVVWGPATRPWGAKASVFHRNAWGATPEQIEQSLRHIAERTPWANRIGGYKPEIHDLHSGS